MDRTGHEKKNRLLEIQALSVSFRQYTHGLTQQEMTAIASLDLTVHAGEIVAVAGASGAGKSLLADAVLGLLPDNACVGGRMYYKGEPLIPERQAALRGKELALVPQSVTCLDPRMRVGAQVDGGQGARAAKKSREKRREVFARLSLPEQTARLYPFQLSGGMARRVLVAAALMTDAELLIADEPTNGIGLPQASETLRMLREQADRGKGVILITHDLESAVSVADRIAVFFDGKTVETAPAAAFSGNGEALRHPYTRALWNALPQNGFVLPEKLTFEEE